jgi:hypothetical protein
MKYTAKGAQEMITREICSPRQFIQIKGLGVLGIH